MNYDFKTDCDSNNNCNSNAKNNPTKIVKPYHMWYIVLRKSNNEIIRYRIILKDRKLKKV